VPRTLCGRIPRKRDKRTGSPEPDGGGFERAWRRRPRAPPCAPRRHRRVVDRYGRQAPLCRRSDNVECPKRPSRRPEHRQVTVMFSDLVGSTALSAPHRPRRSPRGHYGLSEVRRGNRGSLWRVRCEVVFTGAATQHGGQESTIPTMIPTLLHHGMIFIGLPCLLLSRRFALRRFDPYQ
jgi:hypothetical protein